MAYYIAKRNMDQWQMTTAKTLEGAKRIATKTFRFDPDVTCLQVGQEFGSREDYTHRIEVVAIRYVGEQWIEQF